MITVDDVEGWYWDDFNRADIEGATAIFGEYYSESYEGSAWVAYKKNGEWFYHSSGHCSCNGLSWGGRKVTPAEVLLEVRDEYRMDDDLRRELRAFIANEDAGAVVSELLHRARKDEDVTALLVEQPAAIQVEYDRRLSEGEK